MNGCCPICSQGGRLCLELRGYHIFECGICHHRWLADPLAENHIQIHYDDGYFQDGGDGYNNYAATKAVVRRRSHFYLRLLQKLPDMGNSILGIGTAAGFELSVFAEAGFQVSAIEPNASMAKMAANILDGKVHACALEAAADVPAHAVVSMMQVVAHLRDLSACAQQLTSLVQPGGLLLIETWNYRSLAARAFGRYWHEYSPPTVLHWFTPRSLDRLLNPLGFELLQRGRPDKRITGEHAKSLLEYKSRSLPGGRLLTSVARWIPNRWALPYPGDDVFWAVYRYCPKA